MRTPWEEASTAGPATSAAGAPFSPTLTDSLPGWGVASDYPGGLGLGSSSCFIKCMTRSALNNHILNRGLDSGLLLLLFFDIRKITSDEGYFLLLKLTYSGFWCKTLVNMYQDKN